MIYEFLWKYSFYVNVLSIIYVVNIFVNAFPKLLGCMHCVVFTNKVTVNLQIWITYFKNFQEYVVQIIQTKRIHINFDAINDDQNHFNAGSYPKWNLF